MTAIRNTTLATNKGKLVKCFAWSTLSIFVALWLSAAAAEELDTAPAGSSIFVVTNTGDNGSGSLREAITLANASGQPDTLLPALDAPTLVDGLSQDGTDCTTYTCEG